MMLHEGFFRSLNKVFALSCELIPSFFPFVALTVAQGFILIYERVYFP